MKIAAVLGIYALVLAVVPARLLARATWPTRAPRWGIVAWQAASASAVLAFSAAGLALALPSMRLSGSLSTLLRECVMALRMRYQSPGGAVTTAVGATIALAVAGTASAFVGRELLRASLARRAHRRVLAVTALPTRTRIRGEQRRALVVDHASLVAYCLPGRGGRIVLTSAALAALGEDELDAVLAHERAHLAGRHHLVLAVSAGLARAFWFLPLFSTARQQIAVLIEMLADDRAASASEPLAVAGALLALAAPSATATRIAVPMATPAVALSATGTATGQRVRRLLSYPTPMSFAGQLVAGMLSVTVLAAPLVLLLAPAIAGANSTYCPV
jgi:Zn-dependent protease with chaperone function